MTQGGDSLLSGFFGSRPIAHPDENDGALDVIEADVAALTAIEVVALEKVMLALDDHAVHQTSRDSARSSSAVIDAQREVLDHASSTARRTSRPTGGAGTPTKRRRPCAA